MTRLAAAAALLGLLAASPAAADLVCREDRLGATVCQGPAARPMPRALRAPSSLRSDTQALERVLERPAAPVPTFIPSQRRSRLGTTLIDGDRPVGRCRPDRLGNLNCR